jgi:hypothetical protein
MSNNSNFNYLQTIPNEPVPAPSYQPVQQYQQQSFNIQQQQMMGPNGQMVNIPELDKSIMKFQKGNPKYNFTIMSSYLPIKLDQHYKKYFAYFDTIKQRRGQEEYLSDLRRFLNKINEYVSKTEQTIIKLKKTLDYTETTLPVQPQFQPTINGAPPVQNTFIIHELQNVIEKDNHIEFVDIFGLKGKNISHISPEDRMTILIIVQSLMGFIPPPSPVDQRANAKLFSCLNKLKYQISDHPTTDIKNTDKLKIDDIDKNPEFKPLVKIDIYSKLFNIFENCSLNIKDIKTDKISERIETTPEKPSSQSSPYSYSPYSFGGGPEYPSFGGPKRNNEQKNKLKSQSGNSKQNISTKIKRVLKYEIGSTNSGNTQLELDRLVKKKGQEMTEYLFYSTEIQEQLKDIKLDKNKNSTINNTINTIIQSAGQQTGKGKGKNDKGKGKGKGTGSQEIKELNGNSIIKLLKNPDSRYNSLREALKKSIMDKFLEQLRIAYKAKQESELTQTKKEELRKEKKNLDKDIQDLTTGLKNKLLTEQGKKDKQKEIKEKEKRSKKIQIILNPETKYTDSDIEKIVIELNKYLKNLMEQYKTRILFRADESFGNEKCSVIDFFTGIQDTVKISGPYTRNKKNDEIKSITYIQIYMMMYEAYKEYYKSYSIETIIKSFTKDTIKSDNETKMCILNGLGLYSVIVYNQIKKVRDIIKGILLQSNPDFEKAKTMLSKVQTLINSATDEEKKDKLLKIKKNLENEIEKLTNNKKNNRGQNRKNTYGNKKQFNKRNEKPWEKKNKFGDKKYKKSNNNNVSL